MISCISDGIPLALLAFEGFGVDGFVSSAVDFGVPASEPPDFCRFMAGAGTERLSLVSVRSDAFRFLPATLDGDFGDFMLPSREPGREALSSAFGELAFELPPSFLLVYSLILFLTSSSGSSRSNETFSV